MPSSNESVNWLVARRQLGWLSLAMFLGMTLWFSATAATAQIVAEFQLTSAEAAWLTMAVQGGIRHRHARVGDSQSAGRHQCAPAVRRRLHLRGGRERGPRGCADACRAHCAARRDRRLARVGVPARDEDRGRLVQGAPRSGAWRAHRRTHDRVGVSASAGFRVHARALARVDADCVGVGNHRRRNREDVCR